ncbi:branched-chain amino acid ABC transporter permease/ATP-binding protein [Streptomyces sp. NBC_00564]|uniref:branched-chain amino acid ABC transporter permease/ATP-binding protein n=1 Tax=Streptomyces sp. NBC_00564 TaxID=2903663 RepID=UPI002FCD7D8C|nr:branched-chain amino acid ABC transporter permease/ATP-binding protein [Streptomyces sp. NBC_00564]
MNDLLPFVIIGIASGSVYGLAATGLVLTYKTSGILNFGHGAVATTAAYAFYTLHVNHGVPWGWAAFVSVGVQGPALGLLLELMARRLADARTVHKVVATVGLILAVQGFFTAKFGSQSQTFPNYLPTSNAFTLADAAVSWDRVIIALIALVSTAALSLFFRFARLGLAMRGVVDNPELLDTAGTNPVAVRRWAWIIGSTFACMAGVLLAPSLSLDALLLTLLVVQAFGAAAFGLFSSLPLAYAGGIVVGVLASVLTRYGSVTHPNALLTGLPPSVPFLVLFAVLVLAPRRRLTDRRLTTRPLVTSQWRAPARVQFGGGAVLVVALVLVPILVSSARLPTYTDALTKVVLFLSLGLLIRTAGLISLSHMAFAAVGAASMAHFSGGLGLPWLVALLLAGLVAVPVGAFIAIPAIRMSGVFLALATFGFGIALEQMGYPLNVLFGSSPDGRTVPRPGGDLFGGDRGYYYLVLVFVLLASAVVVLIHHSRLGRLLRGLDDSPTALATHGTSVNTTRVLVFCVSAFMAAVYGGLYGGAISAVNGASFSSFSSLVLVAVLVLALGGEPWYAFFAAATMTLPGAYISDENTTYWLNLVFGASAVLVSLTGGPQPIPALRRFLDRIGGRARPGVPGPPTESVEALTSTKMDPYLTVPVKQLGASDVGRPPSEALQSKGVRIEALTVRFGGSVAVNDFSLSAPKGRITGLIGPNGAGKTTTFNVCSGLVRPSSGSVHLHGRDLARLSPATRARRGLGRTFQRMELFDSMTVRENIALGREASLAGAWPWRHIAGSPADRVAIAEAVATAARTCGLTDLLDHPVGGLSTGQRRLVELARCLAGPFDTLLLDEPSSGLNRIETARFGEVLRETVRERDIGVLIIEHDMALVMDVCDYLYVLDFGVPIFEGTPAEVAASDAVRAAYLGSSALGSSTELPQRAGTEEVGL